MGVVNAFKGENAVGFIRRGVNDDSADAAIEKPIPERLGHLNVLDENQFHRVAFLGEKALVGIQAPVSQFVTDSPGPVEKDREKLDPKDDRENHDRDPDRQVMFLHATEKGQVNTAGEQRDRDDPIQNALGSKRLAGIGPFQVSLVAVRIVVRFRRKRINMFVGIVVLAHDLRLLSSKRLKGIHSMRTCGRERGNFVLFHYNSGTPESKRSGKNTQNFYKAGFWLPPMENFVVKMGPPAVIPLTKSMENRYAIL